MKLVNVDLSILDRFGAHFGTALVTTILICQFSFAQVGEEPIEEILVTAERSLRSMKLEVELAQDAVFDVFNEINAGTDYEIICQEERQIKDGYDPHNVSWSVRTCGTRFVRAQEDQAWEDYLDGFGSGSLVSLTPEFEQHNEELSQKFRDLVTDNPEFQITLSEYVTLKASYETALEADEEEGGFFSSLFRPTN